MSKLTSFSLTSQQHKSDTSVNNTTNLYFPASHDVRAVYPDKKSEVTIGGQNTTIQDPLEQIGAALEQLTQQQQQQQSSSNSNPSNVQYASRDVSQTEANNPYDSVTVVKSIDNKTEQMYLAVIDALTSILKNDNKTLITNIIDMSGKVIVRAESLINIVALLCDVSSDKVVINYLDEDVSCLHKFNPVKNIASIKVDSKDMYIQYNTEFNKISNEFSISTSRVVVPKTD